MPSPLASAGVTVEQWDTIHREVRAQAQRAGVAEAALVSAVEAAGENYARSGRYNPQSLERLIIQRLSGQADQIVDLRGRLSELRGGAPPELAHLLEGARTAFDEGRLADADRLLAQLAEGDLAAMQQADAEAQRRRARAGATLASRGGVASLRADFLVAANHYGRAAAVAPETSIEARSAYRFFQAFVLGERGRLFGEPMRLEEAVEIYRENLRTVDRRENRPLAWAANHTNIGRVLTELGERGEAAFLAGAVTSFRAALEVFTPTGNPIEWSATQNNLGMALFALGQRGDDRALRQAIVALNAALEIPQEPISAARVQNNLGNAYSILGQRGDADAVREAIAVYRSALSNIDRSAAPALWSSLRGNLANTLAIAGDRGDESALREAITIYRADLAAVSRASSPAVWADRESNLGATLLALGRRGDAGATFEAIEHFRAALEVRTRAATPLSWATIQNNLGQGLLALGEAGNEDALREAIAAFEGAGEILTREAAPAQWSMVQFNLGAAYSVRASRGDRSYGARALEAFRAAQSGYQQVGDAYWSAEAGRRIAALEK